MRRRFLQAAQGFLLRTNDRWPFSFLNRLPYRLAGWMVGWLFADFPQVEALYVRHSYAQGDWRPGLSDIDLFLVIDEKAGEDLALLLALHRRHRQARYWLPLIGEVEIATARQLNHWLDVGGLRAFEASYWKLLRGQEQRKRSFPLDARFRQHVLSELLFLYAVPFPALLYFPKASPAQFAHLFLKVARIWGYLSTSDPLAWAGLNRSQFLRLHPDPRLERGLAGKLSEDDILEMSAAWLRRLDDDCAPSELQNLKEESLAVPEGVSRPELPELHARIAATCTALAGIPGVEEVVLGNGPLGQAGAFGHHNHRLYVIVTDPGAGLLELVRQVRCQFLKVSDQWPHDDFGLCSCPLVVTRRVFRYMATLWSPAECVYLRRADLHWPDQNVLAEHYRQHYRYLSLYLRNLLADVPLSQRIQDDQGPKSALIDHTLALAMQRAWWQARFVATTPAEAMVALQSCAVEEEGLDRLLQFHRKYAQAPLAAASFTEIREDAFPILLEQSRAIDALLVAHQNNSGLGVKPGDAAPGPQSGHH